MALPIDPGLRDALVARIRFYRELGLTEFYRWPVGVARTPGDSGPDGGTWETSTTETQTILVEEPTSIPSRKPVPAAPPLNVIPAQDRAAALQLIRDEIGDCTRCALHKGRHKLVFADGSPNARLMFVGEGPGADEDAQGLPFVGRAGQLLNNMIKAMGLRREEVYIANIVKCRPPGNRTPERDECDTCSPFLMRQIAVIKPKVVVALGAVAAKNLLAISAPMSELRGRFYDFLPAGAGSDPSWPGAQLAVTYHPAYLLRDPRQKGEAWKDLQMVMRYLGLESPKKPE